MPGSRILPQVFGFSALLPMPDQRGFITRSVVVKESRQLEMRVARMDKRTLRLLQKFRAEAIPANAIRNQGRNVLGAIRRHLQKVDLSTFVVRDRWSFVRRLREATARLQRRLPKDGGVEPAQLWGAARKALNLFLRDCTYDHHLRAHYGLGKVEPWLEVPLDSYVAGALRKTRKGKGLAKWDSLKGLDDKISGEYQEVAQDIADRQGIARVHLDLGYWTGGRKRRRSMTSAGLAK